MIGRPRRERRRQRGQTRTVSQEPASATATRWDIVLMALGAGILAGFQVGKVPPALPVLRESLGLDFVTAGWLTSIYYAIGAALGVAVGLLSDRAGPRRLMLLGVAFLGAGSLLGGLVSGSTWLLIARFIEGFGFVGITVTAPKLIATAARPRDYGLAFGIWGAYMPIGMAIAMLMAPALLEAVGWRGFWLVSAALAALFMVALGWSLHPRRWPATFDAEALDWPGVRATLIRVALWLFGLSFALYTLQWFAIMTWLPTFLIETQGRSAAGAAVWGAMVVASNALGNFAAAWLMHRRVRRWVLIGIAFCAMGGVVRRHLPDRNAGRPQDRACLRVQCCRRPAAGRGDRRCGRSCATGCLRRHGQRLRGAGGRAWQPSRATGDGHRGRRPRRLGRVLVGDARGLGRRPRSRGRPHRSRAPLPHLMPIAPAAARLR